MPGLLSELDLTKQIGEKGEYRERVHELQLSLLHFQRKILESRRNVILVFEGPDAAGKGGVIKRITEKLDPRLIRVYATVKPTEDEYRHHYLWRFWTKMPAQGELAIFDRSWYGRVLVERVEGFCSEKEWSRAYHEINAMAIRPASMPTVVDLPAPFGPRRPSSSPAPTLSETSCTAARAP